jgi:thioesterase domain-containing protein/acyl carrier protein
MLPTPIVVVDSLPLTPGGKVARRALPIPERPAPTIDAELVEPSDGLELQVARVWEELLGVQGVGVRDNFFELGGHSLLAIQLFSRLEERLGQKLPVATLFRAPTVEQLASVIREEDPGADWSILVPIQARGSRPPLFCVHGFGGGVLDYGELAGLLGPDQPFFGLQARGRDGLNKPHSRIEEMAEAYIAAVRAMQPHGPYHLGGYCYGGIVAFEMARQLQAKGESTALLAILEGYAPRGSQAWEPLWRPRVFGSFLRNLPYWLRDTVQREGWQKRLWISVRLRARHGQWGEVRDWDVSYAQRALEDVVGDTSALPEPVLNVTEAHHQAMKRYEPQVYGGRVTLFRVRASTLRRAHEPEMGWGRLAAGGVDIRLIPGAHYSILNRPYVEGLAAELRACLEQV